MLHLLAELKLTFLLIFDLLLTFSWQVVPTAIHVFRLRFGLSFILGEVCLDHPNRQCFLPSDWLRSMLVCMRSPIITRLSSHSSMLLRHPFRKVFHVKFENKNYRIKLDFLNHKSYHELVQVRSTECCRLYRCGASSCQRNS